MWQSLFITVIYLNDVSKKMTKLNKIDENWNLYEHTKNIRTKRTKLNKNTD